MLFYYSVFLSPHLPLLAAPHQPHVKLGGAHDLLQRDTLVIAVDHAALFLGQRHGAEAVHVLADAAIMPRIAAGHHQVR